MDWRNKYSWTSLLTGLQAHSPVQFQGISDMKLSIPTLEFLFIDWFILVRVAVHPILKKMGIRQK